MEDQKLVDLVIDQIKEDVAHEDATAIDELFRGLLSGAQTPVDLLSGYLDDERWSQWHTKDIHIADEEE